MRNDENGDTKPDYHISEAEPWTCPWCGKTYRQFVTFFNTVHKYNFFGIEVCDNCLKNATRWVLEKAKEAGVLIPPPED